MACGFESGVLCPMNQYPFIPLPNMGSGDTHDKFCLSFRQHHLNPMLALDKCPWEFLIAGLFVRRMAEKWLWEFLIAVLCVRKMAGKCPLGFGKPPMSDGRAQGSFFLWKHDPWISGGWHCHAASAQAVWWCGSTLVMPGA